MIYKVLEGSHRQGGKTFTKGQQVDTASNLVALFPNKFAVVSESEAVEAVPVPTPETKQRPDKEFPPFAPPPAAPIPPKKKGK